MAGIDKHPVNDDYKQAVIEAARVFYKRPPKQLDFVKATTKLSEERIKEIRAPFQERATSIYNGLCGQKKEMLDDRLAKLASELTPLAGAVEVVVESIYAGSYASAGKEYSRGAAQLRADEFKDLGIEARVKENSGAFVVLALVASDTDREILKRRGVWTVREWVRRCWGAGLNPRVFNPFLEYGFEEKNGLDYFGNEK